MIKHAVVYRRHDGYYFHADSETTAGVWIASEPFLKLPLEATNAEKGEAARRCVSASRSGVPHPQPKEWNSIFAPMLNLAGCRSWKDFERKASSCHLEVENGNLTVVPQRLIARDKGFQPVPGKIIVLAFEATNLELGEALERAFGLCER